MWPNPQFPADLVTFTEEILNGKLQFLCSDSFKLFIVSLSVLGKHVPENMATGNTQTFEDATFGFRFYCRFLKNWKKERMRFSNWIFLESL